MVILAIGREEGEGEDVCGDEWQAVVRKEDVRATEKEKVVCAEGFRVGDVVRGVVVCYVFLPFSLLLASTARKEWESADLLVKWMNVWWLIVMGGV